MPGQALAQVPIGEHQTASERVSPLETLSRAIVFVLIQRLLFRRHGIRISARSAAVLAYSLAGLLGAATVFGNGYVSGFGAAGARLLALAAVAGATVMFLTRDERAWVGTLWSRSARARD